MNQDIQKEDIRLGTAHFPVKLIQDHRCSRSDILPHWHSFVEMLCIHQGALRVTVNSECHEMAPGDIGLLNAFDVHNMSSENCDYYVIQLESSFLNSFGVELSQWFPIRDEKKILRNGHPFAPRMQALFEQIFNMDIDGVSGGEPAVASKWMKFVEPDTVAKRIRTVSHLTELLSVIMSYTQGQHLDEDILRKSQNNARRLEDILKYVESNYTTGISIQSVSSHVYLTENYFCRFFKQATGNTFFEYLNFFRCIKAEELMRDRQKSISDIGSDVGFKNAAYFNKVYKSVRGVTPAKNRKIIYSQDNS